MAARMTTYTKVAGLNKALRKLPKLVTAELRDASVSIAQDVADRARVRAFAQGGVAALVAPSIRATRDRVPVVSMGNSQRLPPRDGRARTGNRQTIGDIMWGAEFGSKRFTQFQPSRKPGYFLFATVHDRSDEIMDEYSGALATALRKVK